MIIRSELLTEGLFGQILLWMLEIVPYVQQQGWKPGWQIRSRNYGQPPDHDIFPSIIDTTYTPELTGSTVSLEELKQNHAHGYGHDFAYAHRCWTSMFRFHAGLLARVDEFWTTHAVSGEVLGLHYRGTDKNTDPMQTNPVTHYQFLCIVEDFLATHPAVKSIFVATDDAVFLERIRSLCEVFSIPQQRASGGSPLWNAHDATKNLRLAEDALLDCLCLARCTYVLKGMSQLSAFAKIFNPQLEAYRVSACKVPWFPESGIPLHRSASRPVGKLLAALQLDDCNTPPLLMLANRAARRLSRMRARFR